MNPREDHMIQWTGSPQAALRKPDIIRGCKLGLLLLDMDMDERCEENTHRLLL